MRKAWLPYQKNADTILRTDLLRVNFCKPSLRRVLAGILMFFRIASDGTLCEGDRLLVRRSVNPLKIHRRTTQATHVCHSWEGRVAAGVNSCPPYQTNPPVCYRSKEDGAGGYFRAVVACCLIRGTQFQSPIPIKVQGNDYGEACKVAEARPRQRRHFNRALR